MSWIIGEITLPVAPRLVAKKKSFTYTKSIRGLEQPWLFAMGPDVTQLSLEGEIFQSSKSLNTMYSNYISKLENYLDRKNGSLFPQIMPGAPVQGWHSGAGVSVLGSDSTTYVKQLSSMKVTFGSGELYKNFTNDAHFELFNFASIWAKRATSAGKLQITFYNEAYSSRANGYRFYVSGYTSWVQNKVALTGSDYERTVTTVGSPKGWNHIKSIVIEASGAATDNNQWHLDAFFTGVGFVVASPNSRYDGIYALNDFNWEESGGNTYSFTYKITMTDQSQVYGRSKDVI